MSFWTHERDMQVAKDLVDGLTAKEIADRLGTSRNAVIGRVSRRKELRDIGFVRSADFNEKRAKKQAEQLHIETPVLIVANGGVYAAPQHTKSFEGFERLPKPKNQPVKRETIRVARQPAPHPMAIVTLHTVEAPKLRVVSNNTSLMIQDWLEKNGGARKFEQGARSDYFAIQSFLSDQGMSLGIHRNKYMLGNYGSKWRQVSWKEVMATVDNLRCVLGLQPFQRREAAR